MAISYSMCWEDPLIMLEALDVSKRDTVLSIVSGGENLFSLMLNNPNRIIGIDIKKEQIFLTKLKIAAIKNLDFNQFVQFIGIKDSGNREMIFSKLKKGLSKEEIDFWVNSNLIKKGIIHAGKLERYLNKFRRYFLPLIISKGRINEFLSLESLGQQKNFYKYWNNRRFRLLFKLFFSRKGLESGRDKEYFKYNNKISVSEYYLERVKHGLTEVPIKSNFFMQYILTGTIPAPFKNHSYLDRENFYKLKKILIKERIEFVNQDIFEFLRRQKAGSFSKFNLSDVFEGMSQNDYEKLLKEIKRVGKTRGRICYWNNLVGRSVHSVMDIKQLKLSQTLYNKDRVHFYSNFIVEEIN
jgi:S-adenosylmethionine-diacylglycerol 3-amino-3-carboxypropyl transferase